MSRLVARSIGTGTQKPTAARRNLEYWTNDFATLYHADAREIPLPDRSVHCVVTSPPYYNLRRYDTDLSNVIGNESSPDEYIGALIEVFREVKRVLRDDGICWVNLGDTYAGSGKGQKSDGTTGNLPGSKQYSNYGSSVGGLKKEDNSGLMQGNLIGIPWRFAFAMQSDGWILRDAVIWAKSAPMPEPLAGHRWDGETFKRGSWRSTASYEFIYQFTKGMGYYADGEAVKTDTDANRRNVWKDINAENYSGEHYATFPPDLPRICIQASTSEAGVCSECGDQWARVMTGGFRASCDCNGGKIPATVLDPFNGSGTTLIAAQRLGRRGVGVDISTEYLSQSIKRISRETLPMMIH